MQTINNYFESIIQYTDLTGNELPEHIEQVLMRIRQAARAALQQLNKTTKTSKAKADKLAAFDCEPLNVYRKCTNEVIRVIEPFDVVAAIKKLNSQRTKQASYDHIYPNNSEYKTLVSSPELTADYVTEFDKLNHFMR